MSIKDLLKKASWPVAIVALVAPMLAQCGPGGLGGMPGGDKIPGGDQIPGGGKCPNMANADEVASFDWVGNYKVDAKTDAQLKAGLGAAIEFQGFVGMIDADLKTGCGGLAKDLGATEDFKSGEDACKAAAKMVGDVKAKLGAKMTLGIKAEPPKCAASLDIVADCSAKCDVSASGGSAKVECEPGKLQGSCSAQCEGSCDVDAGMSCTGQCSGTCEGTIEGSCGGKCDGKCEGGTMNASGQCSGTCKGKCAANAQGTCTGTCKGSCKMTGKAECKGTCSGSCSAEMKAPKCTGEVKPPSVSAECKAKCDAKASAKVECTPARVVVMADGGADAALQAKFTAALMKNLPIIFKVSMGLADRAPRLAGNVKTTVEGVQAVVNTAASGNQVTGAALTACVAAPFKGAFDAVGKVQGSMKASVDVNVSVNAKASGSASGGTK